MDTALVSAMAGVPGSLVGGSVEDSDKASRALAAVAPVMLFTIFFEPAPKKLPAYAIKGASFRG